MRSKFSMEFWRFKFNQSRFLSLIIENAGDESKKLCLSCLGAGLAQGLAVFSILSGLEQLSEKGVEFQTFLIFILSLAVFYKLFHHITQQAALFSLKGIMQKRMDLAAKLRGVSMESFLSFKRERVQSLLLDGQEIVVEASRMLMAAVANSIMMIVAVFMMFYTSFLGACIVFILMGLGLFIFLKIIQKVNSLMLASKKAEMTFASDLSDLQEGFQHLKISLPKTSDLFKLWLFPELEISAKARKETERTHARGISFFAVFSLLVLGLLLFLLPVFIDIPTKDLTTILVLVIFCVSPLMSLVGFIPMLSKVEMNLSEITAFDKELDDLIEACEEKHVENCWVDSKIDSVDFENLSLQNIVFEYKNKDNLPIYSINIPEFQLNKEEIVFLCGGNGAGKTTFMRVLSGLYLPSSGKLSLNNKDISDYGIDAWRNLFSLVPSNFHLFNHALGLKASAERIQKTLKMLQLEHKVSIDEAGNFSTRDLSAGQRKRLALASAILEDRQIFLLDEVSADFDPEFRKYFYEELLQELRSQKKTIFAISHDDRYFKCADRVIFMEDGRFIEK